MEEHKTDWLNFLGACAIVGGVLTFAFWPGERKEQDLEQRMVQKAEPEAAPVEAPKPEPAKPLEQLAEVDGETGLYSVAKRDSIQFYGERVGKDRKYRRVDRDLHDLLVKMADAYKAEFKQPLFVGPMWDDRGHSNNSKHYKGLAMDIDFGANVGTAQYNNGDRKKAGFLLRYIQRYCRENNKKFSVLFNDEEFVKEGLCKSYPGHHNHIHIGK
jgi:hypothetical protein